jgi:lipopolysaccharide export system permease protein
MYYPTMMNILWRYQIREFSTRFFFFLTFITATLLTFKADSFAKLLSTGISVKIVFFFLLLQIPLVLPMAISISALLASSLLTHKLLTMRMIYTLPSSGVSLNKILAPLFFMGLFCSSLNLFLISDIIPLSRIETYALFQDEKNINPLLILKKGKAPFLKHSFIQMHLHQLNKLGTNLFMLIQDKNTHYLSLLQAESISYDDSVHIRNSSSIVTLAEKEGELPTLLVENVAHQTIPLSFFMPSPSLYCSKKNYAIFTLKEIISAFHEFGDPIFLSDMFIRCGFILLPFSLTFTGTIFSLRSLESKKYVPATLFTLSSLLSVMGIICGKTFILTPEITILLVFIPPLFFIPLAILYKYFLERGRA